MQERSRNSTFNILKPIIGLALVTLIPIALLAIWVFTQKHIVEIGRVPWSIIQTVAWSPQGDRLAVSTSPRFGYGTAVTILDIAAGTSRDLLENPDGTLTVLGWSPDGEQLLVRAEAAFRDHDAGIWLVDVDSNKDPSYLSPGESVTWSSNPLEILILDAKKDVIPWRLAFRVHNFETDTEKILLRTRGITRPGISLSPDGSRIAFAFVPEWKVSEPGMPNDIFLLDTATNQLKRITISGQANFPAWSPSGNLLAYIDQGMQPDVGDTLYIQDMNGGCAYPLLHRDEIVHFAWSPDGSHIAFTLGGSRVFQVDMETELGDRWQAGSLICD